MLPAESRWFGIPRVPFLRAAARPLWQSERVSAFVASHRGSRARRHLPPSPVRQKGSHKPRAREEWPNYTWAFHDGEDIGPRMLARIAKRTGLTPEDL